MMDVEEFHTIYDVRLRRFCARIVGASENHPDVQDLYSETWVKAIRKWDSYEGRNGASRYSWTCTIAKNTWYNTIAKAGRLVLPNYGTEDLYEDRQADDSMRILYKLSDKLRNAIYLNMVGLTGIESCQILGVPLNTYYARVRLARIQLGEEL